MRRLVCLTAALAALALLALLALAGCGGDDNTTTAEGTSGATGPPEVATDGGMTAGEFIDASIPDQAAQVETLVIDNPDCQDVNSKPGGQFQVAVAINAAQASPDTPLEEIVAGQCGNG